MGLKRTSETVTISTAADFVSAVPGGFAVNDLNLPLSVLDREVFVVTAVEFDFMFDDAVVLPISGTRATYRASIHTTRPTGVEDMKLSNTNCLASWTAYINGDGASGGGTPDFSYYEQSVGDTPHAGLDHIGILATDDMFIATDSGIVYAPAVSSNMSIRIYGYRAQADAVTYAALVQSEVLSQ
jgi:hypothetical protein